MILAVRIFLRMTKKKAFWEHFRRWPCRWPRTCWKHGTTEQSTRALSFVDGHHPVGACNLLLLMRFNDLHHEPLWWYRAFLLVSIASFFEYLVWLAGLKRYGNDLLTTFLALLVSRCFVRWTFLWELSSYPAKTELQVKMSINWTLSHNFSVLNSAF